MSVINSILLSRKCCCPSHKDPIPSPYDFDRQIIAAMMALF